MKVERGEQVSGYYSRFLPIFSWRTASCFGARRGREASGLIAGARTGGGILSSPRRRSRWRDGRRTLAVGTGSGTPASAGSRPTARAGNLGPLAQLRGRFLHAVSGTDVGHPVSVVPESYEAELTGGIAASRLPKPVPEQPVTLVRREEGPLRFVVTGRSGRGAGVVGRHLPIYR